MIESVIQIKSEIMINVDVSVKLKKLVCKIYYIWNPNLCDCENAKYSATIIDDSVMKC